jgi:heat shock protein 5
VYTTIPTYSSAQKHLAGIRRPHYASKILQQSHAHFCVRKLSDEEKKTILATFRNGISGVDECGSSASVEDLEEKLVEIQGVVKPITAKFYAGSVAGGKDDDEATTNHDEL